MSKAGIAVAAASLALNAALVLAGRGSFLHGLFVVGLALAAVVAGGLVGAIRLLGPSRPAARRCATVLAFAAQETEGGQLPRLLREGRFYESFGDHYRFSFDDPSSFIGQVQFDSQYKTWTGHPG